MSAVLIVGAGPRLGGAIARRFGVEGYEIALVAEHEPGVSALCQTLRDEGFTARWALANSADDSALRTAISSLAEQSGGITVAIQNVSVFREVSGLELTVEQLIEDVRAGAASLLSIVQAVSPSMIEAGGGTVLATGSAAADTPSKGAPTLGVQKAALRALVQGIAPDLAAQGIHCATVTINGVLGSSPAFEPARIADLYLQIATEPRDAWRTIIPYNG